MPVPPPGAAAGIVSSSSIDAGLFYSPGNCRNPKSCHHCFVVQQVSRNRRLLSNVKPIQRARGDGIHPGESVSFPNEEERGGGWGKSSRRQPVIPRISHRSTNLWGFFVLVRACVGARSALLFFFWCVFAYCGRGDPRAEGMVRRVLPPPRWARSH